MPKKNPNDPAKIDVNQFQLQKKMEIGNFGKNSIIARDLSRNKLI